MGLVEGEVLCGWLELGVDAGAPLPVAVLAEELELQLLMEGWVTYMKPSMEVEFQKQNQGCSPVCTVLLRGGELAVSGAAWSFGSKGARRLIFKDSELGSRMTSLSYTVWKCSAGPR